MILLILLLILDSVNFGVLSSLLSPPSSLVPPHSSLHLQWLALCQENGRHNHNNPDDEQGLETQMRLESLCFCFLQVRSHSLYLFTKYYIRIDYV